jgi:hypothetical protein
VGVQACTAKGEQTWLVVRVTRVVRNLVIVHSQFLPGTKFAHADELRVPPLGALSSLFFHLHQRHWMAR